MPDLIINSLYHAAVDGMELVRRMESVKMTQAELAEKVGCSQSYICQIARPGKWEIRKKTADKIQETLK